MVLFRYTKDLSNRKLTFDKTPYPQHLPVFYIQADDGPDTRQFVSPQEALALYGIETFDLTGAYANHQTFGANVAFKNANVCCIHRMTQGHIANALLSLDVAEVDDIPVYRRDAQGYIIYNQNKEPVQDGNRTTTGFRSKWVLTSMHGFTNDDPLASDFGKKMIGAGSMSNFDGTPSKLYPIHELAYNHKGSKGNLFGYRMFALDSRVDNFSVQDVIDKNIFPYRFGVIHKPDRFSSPRFVETMYSETSTDISFTKAARDRYTNQSYHLDDVLKNRYSNTDDESRPLFYGQFDDLTHVYQHHVEVILDKFVRAELDYAHLHPTEANSFPFSKFNYNPNSSQRHLFNFLSGSDWNGVPYHTFVIDDLNMVANNIRMNRYNNIFMNNGMDNMLSVIDYEKMVVIEVDKYADCDNAVQDLAVNPESILYDTGFTVDTKRKLVNFIAVRPDVFYAAGTYVDDNQVMGYTAPVGEDPAPVTAHRYGIAEEIGVATALTARFNQSPESTYFGTPVVRGLIYGGSCKWLNSPWPYRVSMIMDLIDKASRMMGAANGRWKAIHSFASAFDNKGNLLLNSTDINIPWIPPRLRIINWEVGLVLPLMYQRGVAFTPGMKTVHPNSTSVLNNFKLAMVICKCNKVAHEAWREFAGTDDLTDALLLEYIEQFVTDRTDGIFAGEAVTIPDATMTADDKLRGYSVSLAIDVYAGNMRTVFNVHVRAHRLSDLDER